MTRCYQCGRELAPQDAVRWDMETGTGTDSYGNTMRITERVDLCRPCQQKVSRAQTAMVSRTLIVLSIVVVGGILLFCGIGAFLMALGFFSAKSGPPAFPLPSPRVSILTSSPGFWT